MWSALWMSVAFAGVPDGVRPAVAPVDVQSRYDRYLATKGREPVSLACEPPIADALRLCFKVWENDKRRWVSQADLQTWSVTLPDLRQALAAHATQVLAEELEVQLIEGTTRSYRRLADGDGWAAAGLLAPTALEKLVPRPMMALPQTSMMLVWSAGDAEVDLIMAVGAKETREAARDPVSAVVLRWDGKRWVAFAEAERSETKKTGPTP